MEDAERAWPAHKRDEEIVACVFEAEGREWARQYLMVDVRQMQTKKRHHVHTINEHAQEREPLTSCRRKDNPALCEADFPHTKWLIEEPVILCYGLLRRMG